MRLHLAMTRKAERNGRPWRAYWPDVDSYGAVHLGRFRIDFGVPDKEKKTNG